MRDFGGKIKLALFLVLALLLGLQLSLLSLAPAGADNPLGEEDPEGWYEQYYDENAVIMDISAADSNTCWAVGGIIIDDNPEVPTQSLILKTVNGGESWTPQTLPPGVALNSISAVNADICWACGINLDGYGVILHTIDGGTNWNVVTTFGYSWVGFASAVNDQTCWLAGISHDDPAGGYIARTTDGGASWTFPVTQMPYPMFDISATSEDACWAVGGRNVGGDPNFTSEGVILKTIDGGANWTTYGPYDSFHFDVSAVSSEVAWVLGTHVEGEYYFGHPECYTTTDGGNTWKTNEVPLETMLRAELCAIDANTAWGVTPFLTAFHPLTETDTSMGMIYKTTDGGDSWSLQAVTPEDRGLHCVSAVDANTAWAAGYNMRQPAQTQNGSIMHTTDGGWPPPPHIDSIDPTSGTMDDVIAISGTNFGTYTPYLPTSFQVLFGSTTAEIVSWSDTQIECRVPEGLTPGPIDITVKALGQTSNAVTFESILTTIIIGSVKTGNNEPLPGIEINLYDLDQNLLESGLTDSGGEYNIITTLPDTTTKIEFRDPNNVYQTEWHKDKPDFASADPYELKGGSINDLGTENLEYYPPTVLSISPDSVVQCACVVALTVEGSGFHPRAEVRLEIGDYRIWVYNKSFVSETKITGYATIFMAYTGPFDVVVRNPDGQEARLSGGFTVTPLCGAGSGSALLMLGLALGLLSLAGTGGIWKRRRMRKAS